MERLDPKGIVGSWPFSLLSSGCLGDGVSDFALAHTLAMPYLLARPKAMGLMDHGSELPKMVS